MKRKNIIFGISVIILIALIGFNLNKMTGESVKEDPSKVPVVSVFPTEVKAGEKITAVVKLRGYCVSEYLEVFEREPYPDGDFKIKRRYMPIPEDFESGVLHSKSSYCLSDRLKNNEMVLTFDTGVPELSASGNFVVRATYKIGAGERNEGTVDSNVFVVKPR